MSMMIRLLLQQLDQAFDRRSWHGTNLRGSLRGLSHDAVLWRPAPGHHNIWELAVHAAYWKYAVRRRLTGGKKGSFPLKGSNFWPRTDQDSPVDWRRDVALLVEQHRALRVVVEKFPERRLRSRPSGSRFTYAALIQGIAAHDLYHAGQIQLLKRLMRAPRTR